MKRWTRALAVSFAVLLVLLLGIELTFRSLVAAETKTLIGNLRTFFVTGMMRGYEPRAYTVYQRPRGVSPSNAQGFNDCAWTRARTPGVPRIVCMGGSTTEGGNNAGFSGTYPCLLERTLEARTGRDFEVLNAGMSGWTSAEMVAAWFLTMQDFAPDVVILHEAVNDNEPRFYANFEPDYSHWRRSIQIHPVTGLERLAVQWSDLYVYYRMRGGKAPEIQDVSTDRSGPKEPMLQEGKMPHATSLPFRRNIQNIARDARADGRQVVLMTLPTGPQLYGAFWDYGIEENNQHLRELCAENGYVLADAARAFAARPELKSEFIDTVHLQPAGNQVKAEILADALAAWVAGLSPEGARPPVDPRK